MTIGWKGLVVATVLLGPGLATWHAQPSRAAEEWETAPPGVKNRAGPETPKGNIELAPSGKDGPIEPAPPGKDGSGQPPLATEKDDREDLLGGQPLNPARRLETLETLYERLRIAKDAKKAEPIAEAIEQAWRSSGSDTVNLLMSHVDTFLLAGELDLAMQVLDAIADLSPDNAEAWHQRAIVAVMQNNLEGAFADLKRALSIDPKHYKARRDLGAVLEQMGEKEGALKAYREVLETNPFLDQARQAAEKLSAEIEGRRGI
jgi:tetratricopeptide (TPR) repeat protein